MRAGPVVPSLAISPFARRVDLLFGDDVATDHQIDGFAEGLLRYAVLVRPAFSLRPQRIVLINLDFDALRHLEFRRQLRFVIGRRCGRRQLAGIGACLMGDQVSDFLIT
jgi:hypothetical protein